MDLSLKGKVALVTGGGRHIGRQIALTLAQEGAKVVVNDYFADRASAVAAEIREMGGEAIGLPADVRSQDAVNAMVSQALEKFGKIDVLVNNAGMIPESVGQMAGPPFADSDKTLWDNTIEVNLYGVLNCTRAVLPGMIKQHYGKVVSMISDAGRSGEARLSTYAAAKAGIVGFTKSMAKEVGRHAINFNCVSLGATPQPGTITEVPDGKLDVFLRQYPLGPGLGRLGQPSDAANAVAFFASDASAWVTGQVLSVSGGFSMVD